MTIPIRIAATRREFLAQAALAAVLIAAPAAFAQADKPKAGKSAESPAAGKEYTVAMSNMDFGAIPSNLKVGDTIVFVNHDTVIHSVTARDHSFDLRINPSQSGRVTLMTPGRIAIYCLFHPNMRGAITVAAK